MLPEEQARVKIDEQLVGAGWEVVTRFEYNRKNPSAVTEASMLGRKESDYLLFIDNKAIAVVEAKRAERDLDELVAQQAENYTATPQSWYGFWLDENKVPLVYLANGEKILFKNMLDIGSEYQEIEQMHTPKEMLRMIGKSSDLGALPTIERKGLRDCQYRAEVNLEASFKDGKKKALAVLATGSGKTYLACLASYRFLEYTPSTKRILFLADRNNLANQAQTEFKSFNRTETGQKLEELYDITRLRKEDDIKGNIVISTIQKLYAVLTGRELSEIDEDAEDEKDQEDKEKHSKEVVLLGDDLKLPPDYFQFIIVDECHRSIYGRWKAVLDYFNKAKVLGLTATPTDEAVAYFDKNIIENYSYDDSVVDGVNVPQRIFRIITKKSIHGGTINEGDNVREVTRKTGESVTYPSPHTIEYSPNALDRSIVNTSQIETVLREYRNSIYTKLYPERFSETNDAENWSYIPKTLIFAKDDNHADTIVEIIKKVFKEKFDGDCLPENFVKKITYSAGDSNALIRDFRTEKDFRIAVTVTLVATGTDVKPLEVVLFMRDVNSSVLYTQMKGRACRYIGEDKLHEVTPNAQTKGCYYIVDAVGVTEHEKNIPSRESSKSKERTLSLEHLLERLSHDDVCDDNLELLRDYCATIHRRYEDNALHGYHLTKFISEFGFAPRTLASEINDAIQKKELPPFVDASHENAARMSLIACLIDNIPARKALLEMQRGYYTVIEDPDEVIRADFTKETAREFTKSFEKYLRENKDKIEALRIIYNSEDTLITHSMLMDLSDKLLSENRAFTPYNLWTNYKLLDDNGYVDDFDIKQNVRALTHLIQLVRYAYHKTATLTSLYTGYAQRFNLYCGQAQRQLTDDQKALMRQIADFVVGEGAITLMELNEYYPDLWRQGMIALGAETLNREIQTMSKFILKAA